jgi:2-polyprenyl-3-methyl-5-hydroxy-6-metoxy-1,4-benzoquinol methylase
MLPPQRRDDVDERNWWDVWNKAYRTEEGRDEVSSELFSRVAATVAQNTPAGRCRILEIGCGSGTLSRMLSCTTYHGIDISPAAIEIARIKADQGPVPTDTGLPVYEAADFHDWQVPRAAFDLAVCVDAIAYFRDQGLAVRKMAESLSPTGKLILTTINPWVYDRIRRTAANPLQEGPVSHWLTRAELHGLIESAGLAVERSYTIMPRGNMGILRVINSWRLNGALGSGFEGFLRHLKEYAGLGQYRIVVARAK